MNDKSLSGRVAIVTGGGRGLGRAMALGLAGAGARVVITAALENAEIEAVAEEARRACGEERVLGVIADVTDDDACRRVVDTAVGHFGGLDILVNNAGRGMKYVSNNFLTEPTRFWETDPKVWRTVIDINVNGPFLMARHAVPIMLKAGWGRIINISMNRSTMSRRGFSPYAPSKAAVEFETVVWSQDLAGTGITVNALLPGGPTLTGMIPDNVSEEAGKKLLKPMIMVPPLLWLASTESDGVTGRRFVGTSWPADRSGREAAEAAGENAGWPS